MSELVAALLPFVVLVGVWFLVMRTGRSRMATSDPQLQKLEDIRTELERIRLVLERERPERSDSVWS